MWAAAGPHGQRSRNARSRTPEPTACSAARAEAVAAGAAHLVYLRSRRLVGLSPLELLRRHFLVRHRERLEPQNLSFVLCGARWQTSGCAQPTRRERASAENAQSRRWRRGRRQRVRSSGGHAVEQRRRDVSGARRGSRGRACEAKGQIGFTTATWPSGRGPSPKRYVRWCEQPYAVHQRAAMFTAVPRAAAQCQLVRCAEKREPHSRTAPPSTQHAARMEPGIGGFSTRCGGGSILVLRVYYDVYYSRYMYYERIRVYYRYRHVLLIHCISMAKRGESEL